MRAYCLWAGKDIFRATLVVTQGFFFQFNTQDRLVYDKQVTLRIYSNPDLHGN